MLGVALSLVLATAALPGSFAALEAGFVGVPPGKARVLDARWMSGFDGTPACRTLSRVQLEPVQRAGFAACRGQAECLVERGREAGAAHIVGVAVAAIGLGDDGPFSVSATVLDTATAEPILELTQGAPDMEKLFGVFRYFVARACRSIAEAAQSSEFAALLPPMPPDELALPPLPDLDLVPLDPEPPALQVAATRPTAPAVVPARKPATELPDLPLDLADIPIAALEPAALEPLPPVTDVPAVAVVNPPSAPATSARVEPLPPPAAPPATPAIVARPEPPTPTKKESVPPPLPPAAAQPLVTAAPVLPAWAVWVASGVALASGIAGAGLGSATLAAAAQRDASTARPAFLTAQADAERLAVVTNVVWTLAAASAASAAGLWLATPPDGAGH